MVEASRQNKQLRNLPQIHTVYKTLSDSYVKEKGWPQQHPDFQEDSRSRIDVYAESTADFAISRKIGSAFFASGHLPRCRSPPASEIRTQQVSETEDTKVSKSSKSHRNGGNSWRDKRNYRRIYDENGNVVANIITVDGVDVEVTEEVFRAYSQMDRRERYLSEDVPAGKVLSLERMAEDEVQLTYVGAETFPDVADLFLEKEDEETRQLKLDEFRTLLASFSDDDRYLLEKVFLEGVSIREYARTRNVSDTAIRKRKKRILKKILEKYQK